MTIGFASRRWRSIVVLQLWEHHHSRLLVVLLLLIIVIIIIAPIRHVRRNKARHGRELVVKETLQSKK
jgi:hypothetical protein